MFLRGLWGESSEHLRVMLHDSISQLYEEENPVGAGWSWHTFWSQEEGNLLLRETKMEPYQGSSQNSESVSVSILTDKP